MQTAPDRSRPPRSVEDLRTEMMVSTMAVRQERDRLYRERLRLVLAWGAVFPILGLAWLVIHGEPLPLADLRSSALVTVIFCLLVIVLVLYVQRLPLLSFSSLFLGTTFLFTCSPLILYQFEGMGAFSNSQFVDVPGILAAMPVIMLAFSSFLLGSMLLSATSWDRDPTAIPEPDGDSLDLRLLWKIGVVVYVISALFIAGSSLRGGGLTFAFEGGYKAFHTAKKGGLMSQLVTSGMAHLLPWSLLMLTAASRDRRSRMIVVLLSLPAIAVLLAAGDRSTAIPTVALIAAGFSLLGVRIDWIRSLGVAAVIVFIIPTILNLRSIPISQWSPDALRASVKNQVENTPTYGQGFAGGFLVSMTSSYQTLMATVMVIPENEGFHYGSDYLSSLVVAVPFHSVWLPFLNREVRQMPPSQWVMSILHPGRDVGAGYLQVAEAYLEFGAIGVIGLYLALGWGLLRLWRFVAAKRSDPRALAFVLIIMMETLIWVRNSSSLFVRGVAWGWLLIYVLPALLKATARHPTPVTTGRTWLAHREADP